MNIVEKIITNNFTKGRSGQKVKRIILHTYGGPGESLYNWFNKPGTNASAHFAVFKNGTVEQYVWTHDTAWHAGDNSNPNNNLVSIGIEHQDDANPADSVRTDELYDSSAQLLAKLCKEYDIPLVYLDSNNKQGSGISLHKFYASDGRSCPGGLDYNRLISEAKKYMSTTPQQAKQEIGDDFTEFNENVYSDQDKKIRAQQLGGKITEYKNKFKGTPSQKGFDDIYNAWIKYIESPNDRQEWVNSDNLINVIINAKV